MDWNGLAAQTLDVIKSVGITVNLRRKTSSNFDAGSGVYSNLTAETTSSRGILKYPKPSGFEDGKTIRQCDIIVLMAASGMTLTPQAGDMVTAGSETFQVLDVRPVSPAGIPLLYYVYCKR